MPVITLANPKGGTGKTLSALLLASELSRDPNVKITLLELDTNAALFDWSLKPNKPANVTVYSAVTHDLDKRKSPDDVVLNSENIVDIIEDASASSNFVVVDLEGTADYIQGDTFAVSDLVLIPANLSPDDVMNGAKIAAIVARKAKRFQLNVPAYFVLNRVNPAIQSKVERAIRQQITANNIPHFATEIVERAPFKQFRLEGGTLYDIADRSKSVRSAIDNAHAFVREALEALTANKQASAAE